MINILAQVGFIKHYDWSYSSVMILTFFSALKTNSFSKCTKCTSLERQLERTRDRQERKYLKQLLSQHNERQM